MSNTSQKESRAHILREWKSSLGIICKTWLYPAAHRDYPLHNTGRLEIALHVVCERQRKNLAPLGRGFTLVSPTTREQAFRSHRKCERRSLVTDMPKSGSCDTSPRPCHSTRTSTGVYIHFRGVVSGTYCWTKHVAGVRNQNFSLSPSL